MSGAHFLRAASFHHLGLPPPPMGAYGVPAPVPLLLQPHVLHFASPLRQHSAPSNALPPAYQVLYMAAPAAARAAASDAPPAPKSPPI